MLVTEWKAVTAEEAMIISNARNWFISLNEWEKEFFESLRVAQDEEEILESLSHRQRVTLWNIAIRHQQEAKANDLWQGIDFFITQIKAYRESLRVVIQQDKQAA